MALLCEILNFEQSGPLPIFSKVFPKKKLVIKIFVFSENLKYGAKSGIIYFVKLPTTALWIKIVSVAINCVDKVYLRGL